MFLCLGPTGSGKTSILEKLQNASSSEVQLPTTVPTVGTNLTTIDLVGSKKKSKLSACVRELGGAMAPIWHKYYRSDNLKGVIFVIDACNPKQISAASIMLLTCLDHDDLHSVPFLVLLNKVDACVSPQWTAADFKFLLRLPDLEEHARQSIAVLETSCKTPGTVASVKDWMTDKLTV